MTRFERMRMTGMQVLFGKLCFCWFLAGTMVLGFFEDISHRRYPEAAIGAFVSGIISPLVGVGIVFYSYALFSGMASEFAVMDLSRKSILRQVRAEARGTEGAVELRPDIVQLLRAVFAQL